MRGPVQTSDRRRLRAGAWLTLLVSAAAAQAQGPPSAEQAAEALAESISLTADRVRYWDADGRHWALLEGRAAILQGADGLRADRAVVRFGPEPGRATTRIEVFAEAARRTDGDGRVEAATRLELATGQVVRLNTYARPEPERLASPPRLAILGRAFPRDDATTARPEPPPRRDEPTSRQAQAEVSPPVEPESPPDESTPSPDAAPPTAPMVDPAVQPAQFVDDDQPIGPAIGGPADDVQDAEAPAIEGGRGPDLMPDEDVAPPTDVEALPPSDVPAAPPRPTDEEVENPAVLVPYTARTFNIAPRDYKFNAQRIVASDGTPIIVIRGGVNVRTQDPKNGIVDVSSDNAVVWLAKRPEGGAPNLAGDKQDANARFEIFLEGNVVMRQDKRKVAGNGDVTILKADRLYMDFRTERKIAQNAEIMFYAPGLLAPVRTTGTEINQFTPQVLDDKGRLVPGMTEIRSDNAQTTGSRFPKPGYLFSSRSVDLFQRIDALTEPNTGRPVGNPRDPKGPKDRIWTIDARQNVYYIGPVPVFYWPRIVADSDDLDPPLRTIRYQYGNYFGHQFYGSWNAFKLFNWRKPTFIDNWNIDTDYLSIRGPALGSEVGWFGNDIIGDLTDPFHRNKKRAEVDRPYYGYFDIWGILDHGNDVLGTGPAVVTYGPPGFGKTGNNGFPYQRDNVPPSAQSVMLRGKVTMRHMQFLLPGDLDDEDMRLQVEVGYLSDRHFLEEYQKRLFDSGLDQETLAYFIWQRENRAFTVHTEVNLNNWNTESQWFPKLEYYRLGDSLLGNLFNYSQDSGFDYADTHSAVEVNNPNIFAFIPYDPVSNTFGSLKTARAWTSHELDLPIDLGVLRVVPYGQGQLVGWNNQLGGQMIGRAWGAGGIRANVMAWRTFSGVDNELFNIHGLAHKVNFNADYRTAYSNVNLNRIGVQDDLDDNTYEFTRRYFALTNYVGGVLPAQYDPRFLTLRRAISPIAGSTDIQSTIQTLQFNLNQRLQTKRGPEGKRRIVDWMILDLKTTYFPIAGRDNFGKPFGQNMYNYEWFLGDRTSIVSTGWFEFWQIQGNPVLVNDPRHTNDAFGLAAINTGIALSRPPRGQIYLGYSIVNTGVIQSSAPITQFSYWLSPKWYSTATMTYDFGNAILLGATLSLTRIGADFLTSVGLSVDPQRNNYTFGLEIVPRFSPNVRLGSAPMAQRFDTRFAPTQ